LLRGAQYGSAPAKAALARFDALAAGDPEDVESFVVGTTESFRIQDARFTFWAV
jgi:hypothetical protein